MATDTLIVAVPATAFVKLTGPIKMALIVLAPIMPNGSVKL